MTSICDNCECDISGEGCHIYILNRGDEEQTWCAECWTDLEDEMREEGWACDEDDYEARKVAGYSCDCCEAALVPGQTVWGCAFGRKTYDCQTYYCKECGDRDGDWRCNACDACEESDNGRECARCQTTWCEGDEHFPYRLLWEAKYEPYKGQEICRDCVSREDEENE
jgi:hypothetical protein